MILYCRLCAAQKDPAKLIASVSDLKERLIRCCRWQECNDEDQLPQRACDMCLVSLDVCWRFMDQIVAANSKLKDLLLLNEPAIPIKPIEAVYFNNDDAIEDVKKIEMQSADSDIHLRRSTRLRKNQLESVEVSGQPIKFKKFSMDQNPLVNNDLVDDMKSSLCKVEINDSENTSEQPNIGQDPDPFDPCDSPHLKQEDDIYNDDYSPDGPPNRESSDDLSSDSAYEGPTKSKKGRRAASKSKKKITPEYAYYKFLKKVPKEHQNADGTISAQYLAELENHFPDMKIIKWADCEYRCDECNELVIGYDNFYSHSRSLHPNKMTGMICYCDRRIPVICDIRRHITTYHYFHLRYSCPYCPLYFWSPDKLLKHRDNDHVHSLACLLCNKNYIGKNNLLRHVINQHIRKENPDKYEKFICDICKSGFNEKCLLRSHMFTHSKTKNRFVCEHCGRSFLSKQNLDIHIEAQHLVLEKLFTCPVEQCERKFRSKLLLGLHIPRHEPKNEQFKCDLCPKVYSCKNALRGHRLIHKPSKPYNCSSCDKSFVTKYKLNVHERTHSGMKPYACPKCSYTSATNGNLSKHTMRIHSLCIKQKPLFRIEKEQVEHKQPAV